MIDKIKRSSCSRQATWTVALLSLAFFLAQSNKAVAQVAGSGNAGKIAKWTGSNPSSTLTDSAIADLNGNIGIGNAAPDRLLVVQGTVTPGGAMTVIRTTGASNGSGLQLDAAGGGNNNIGLAVNGTTKAVFSWDNTRSFWGVANIVYSPNDFSLRVNGVGSLTYCDASPGIGVERFRITASGNVGIATTSPTTKLHVAGNVTVKANGADAGNITADGTISGGNVIARYQDVAEWVPSSRLIPAGTVVVLDVEQSNHVLPSSRAYDTSVAGVVSASPGVILGEAGAGKVMVATTGRVRVKVDATRAPIRVGDLLVASDKEGIAMRSQPLDLGGTPIHRPGTLIGKALEPLEKGVGEILVLLSLQ
jgi:hypothetical protein